MAAASIPPVLLVLGAGSNIGSSVAHAFAAKGYKVAVTSRMSRADQKDEGYLHIQSDLSDPESVTGVFEQVREALGHPSVVVYNGQYVANLRRRSELTGSSHSGFVYLSNPEG